ncbi:MAG: aminotransferase class I/II-fold pyridoxal phosphate-dependent enzyme, partial [Chloroflexota bacterium]
MPQLAQRVQKYGTTIFTEINNLAAQYDTVNLGQGKPDFDSPPEMVQAAVEALQSGAYSQYAPGPGAGALREAIAAHMSDVYGLSYDVDGGVIVTCGATEGLYAAIAGTIDVGDEVIVLEPFYDIYVPIIEMAGGVPVYVPLRVPDWTLDADALREAFSERTRAIVINTPNNPTGRTFTRSELESIAALCVEHDAVCIADSVYEHMTYDDAQHLPIASLTGMFERTLLISSVAKTYSATGWKTGWVVGG